MYYERYVKEAKFHTDDDVWLFQARSKCIACRSSNPKWKAPYKICVAYRWAYLLLKKNVEKGGSWTPTAKFYRNESYGKIEKTQ